MPVSGSKSGPEEISEAQRSVSNAMHSSIHMRSNGEVLGSELAENSSLSSASYLAAPTDMTRYGIVASVRPEVLGHWLTQCVRYGMCALTLHSRLSCVEPETTLRYRMALISPCIHDKKVLIVVLDAGVFQEGCTRQYSTMWKGREDHLS